MSFINLLLNDIVFRLTFGALFFNIFLAVTQPQKRLGRVLQGFRPSPTSWGGPSRPPAAGPSAPSRGTRVHLRLKQYFYLLVSLSFLKVIL
jgi:hypothetical protein